MKINWWKKSNKIKTWKKSRPAIDPPRDGLILCWFFAVCLVAASLGIGALRLTIAKRETAAYSQTSAQAEKLDQAKLDLIIAESSSTAAKFVRLQAQKPSVVDPGQ